MSKDAEWEAALLQERWLGGFLPWVDGVVFATGRVVKISRPAESLNLPGVLEVGAISTLGEQLPNFFPDPWVSTTALCQATHGDWVASAGGGEMGNEGFVAVHQAAGRRLLWAAAFTFSNPFYEITVDATAVHAKNNHEHIWSFSHSTPEHITITQV